MANLPISLVIDEVLRYRVRNGKVVVTLDVDNGTVITITEPPPLGCAVFCLPRDGKKATILPWFQEGKMYCWAGATNVNSDNLSDHKVPSTS